MKRRLLCSAGCLSVLLLAGTAVPAAEEVRIGWVFAMANAPVLIAEEKGYFADEGLDVKTRSFTSGPLVHQALSAGELDMAYIGAAPVYHWYSRGLKSRILAKVNYGQVAVVTRRDSGINTLADLKGKKMAGVRKGSGMDVLLRGYVLGEAANLVPGRDVQILQMPSANMGPAVEEKVVDAAIMWEPFTSHVLLRGSAQVILDMNEVLPNYPWYIIMAMPKTLKKKPDAIVKVLRAHKRAVEYLNSGPDAGNALIAKTFKLEEVVDESGNKYSPTEVVRKARERLGWEWNLNDKDMVFIQRLMNYSYHLGYIKKELDANELVDLSYVKKAGE